MTSSTPIKEEIKETCCFGCLSINRETYPLEDDTYIYRRCLTSLKLDVQSFSNIYVCWECKAMMRKIIEFEERVKQAQSVLQRTYELEKTFIFGISLSRLSVVINNNFDYTFEEEDPPKEDIEYLLSEDVKEDFDIKSEGTDEANYVDNDISNEADSENVHEPILDDAKKEKMHQKFKLTFNDMASSIVHTKIDDDELKKVLDTIRNDEQFKAKKQKCESCLIVFDSCKSLRKHESKCHLQSCGDFVCHICERRFLSKRILLPHVKKHYFKYFCTLCDNNCYDYSEAKGHFHMCHEKTFHCINCEYIVGNRKLFFEHYRTWHCKYICDYCNVTCKSRFSMEKHMRLRHTKFKCEICGSSYKGETKLKYHKLRHEKNGTEESYCVECDKQFDNAYRYKSHLKISNRHNPKAVSYPCTICGKIFTRKLYMRKHHALVHMHKTDYYCEKCDKYLSSKFGLEQHRKRVHAGYRSPKDKFCEICGRGFSTKNILIRHMRTHTGERPYECKLCPAKFSQISALKSHVKHIHFKEKRPVKNKEMCEIEIFPK